MTDKNESKLRYATIKGLENRAKKGDIKAITQLYERYYDGYGVEKKLDKAESYLVDLSREVKNKKLFIKELVLKDFRSFSSFKSTFHSELTIFVGGNGTGKTAVLESLCLALKFPSRCYVSKKANTSTPEGSDIKNGSKEYCDISVGMAIHDFKDNSKNDGTFQSSFVANSELFLGRKSGKHEDFKLLGNIYRYISKQDETFFPFFYYYSVKRISTASKSLSQIENEMFKDKINSERLSILKGNLDGSTNISNTLQFFMQLDSRARSNEFDNIDSLEKEVEDFEKIVSSLDEDKIPESLSQTLLSKRKALEILQQEKQENFWHSLRTVVIEAVKSIVPEVEGLFIDRTSGEPVFKVRIDGEELEFDQLSAGFQVMTGLAMDIALRMAWLNPSIKKPLEVTGVILIDEIELHLHPEWQQRVILDLHKTFPNIQFIVTTHSPQVLSTVDKKCIRKLVIGQDGLVSAETPYFQTRGVGSMDILNRIMDAPSVPDVPEHKLVLDFGRALSKGDECESKSLLSEIIEHFGAQHPVVADCESQKRIAEIKRRRKDSSA
ncbi:hypothetical protein A8139_01430 [Marinomonas primoryensis]|uniref:AAA+ ATPase domain-containing protein n=1 Tax=Marinomonas primoryensis TaxID=178399 RepID=A0A2Z4PMX4_9GAMM|nr:AAA family ATPase [Marinomonas primoryensis]AWX98802.1 hypothetical protein A8139_01430 [Marinomonas primoryensis]